MKTFFQALLILVILLVACSPIIEISYQKYKIKPKSFYVEKSDNPFAKKDVVMVVGTEPIFSFAPYIYYEYFGYFNQLVSARTTLGAFLENYKPIVPSEKEKQKFYNGINELSEIKTGDLFYNKDEIIYEYENIGQNCYNLTCKYGDTQKYFYKILNISNGFCLYFYLGETNSAKLSYFRCFKKVEKH